MSGQDYLWSKSIETCVLSTRLPPSVSSPTSTSSRPLGDKGRIDTRGKRGRGVCIIPSSAPGDVPLVHLVRPMGEKVKD